MYSLIKHILYEAIKNIDAATCELCKGYVEYVCVCVCVAWHCNDKLCANTESKLAN